MQRADIAEDVGITDDDVQAMLACLHKFEEDTKMGGLKLTVLLYHVTKTIIEESGIQIKDLGLKTEVQ